MAVALKCSSCGHEQPADQTAEQPAACPACGNAMGLPADDKPAPIRVSAADLVTPGGALPKLRTFEELGIADKLRQEVEKQLAKDEKVIWLGRPSTNPEVYPPRTIMVVIGVGLLIFAVLLPIIFSGMSLIFPIAFGLFGVLFCVAPLLFNPANTYKACYVITDRRALLVEFGVFGHDPRASSLFGARTQSYQPHELLGLERQENPRVAGAGDLVFEYIFTIGNNATAFPGTQGTVQRTDTPQRTARGFLYLDDAADVEQLLHATLLANVTKTPEQRAKFKDPALRKFGETGAPPIGVNCICGAALEAPAELAGQSVKCPKCAAAVVIPGEQPRMEPITCREEGNIPAAFKEKARAELGPNEQLVWMAQPAAAVVFRRSLGYLVGGGIAVLLALILLLAGGKGTTTTPAATVGKPAIQGQPNTAAPARITSPLAVIVLLGGLGCMVVPLYRWFLATRTCYALTTRRALVYKQGLFGPMRESYSPVEVSSMRRMNSWLFPGGGDLVFRSVTVITRSRRPRSHALSESATTIHYGFLNVPQLDEVGKLVQETLVDPYARAGAL